MPIHIKIVNFGSRYPIFWLSVYFWKWKPPWERNQKNVIFFSGVHVLLVSLWYTNCLVNFSFFWSTKKNEKLTRQLVYQRDWQKVHGRRYHLQTHQYVSILVVETHDFGYLSFFESYEHGSKTFQALFVSPTLPNGTDWPCLVSYICIYYRVFGRPVQWKYFSNWPIQILYIVPIYE